MGVVTVTATKATTSVELSPAEAAWLARRVEREEAGADVAARIESALVESGSPGEVALEEHEARLVKHVLDEEADDATPQLSQLRDEIERWL